MRAWWAERGRGGQSEAAGLRDPRLACVLTCRWAAVVMCWARMSYCWWQSSQPARTTHTHNTDVLRTGPGGGVLEEEARGGAEGRGGLTK